MRAEEYDYVTVVEAAGLLRVSVPTVWRWVRNGRLAAVRIGPRNIRIQRSALRATIKPALPAGPAPAVADASGWVVDIDEPEPIAPEELIARLRRHRARMLDRRGGKPLPDSTPLIRAARAERTRRL